MKDCKKADWEKFWPAHENQAHEIDQIKSNSKRMMVCLDWSELGLSLHGTEISRENTRLEIMVLPCQHKLSIIGGEEDSTLPICDKSKHW